MYGQLIFCILGIYIFFICWGVLQERITTIEYRNDMVNESAKFSFFLFLNLMQSLIACLICFIYSRIVSFKISKISWKLFKEYTLTAVFCSLSSPFGYRALKHINYPTMILGKSCKLLPVMLMNILIYRKKFDKYKYLTVLLITIGVSGFMLFEGESGGKMDRSSARKSHTTSLLGISLLLVNLLLDGTTNSLQDKIFIRHGVCAQHVMFYMTFISSILMLSYLLLNPYTHELHNALLFIKKYPSCIFDVFLFSFCNAMGQNFIYYTLEKFGSLTLVKITLTRKLFTILISLFYFKHKLNWKQWCSVILVFIAIILESLLSRKQKRSNHTNDHKTAITMNATTISDETLATSKHHLHVRKKKEKIQ